MGSVFRALLGVVFIALAGMAGLFVWEHFETERALAREQRRVQELSERLERVWSGELVADLKVDRVWTDPDSGQPLMDLTFVQYAPGTEVPLFRRQMTLPGDEVYVDALVVRFERPLVEVGDGLAGRGLLLFRRAFGSEQAPSQGVPLWAEAASREPLVPGMLRLEPGAEDLERRIWTRFWTFANDPAQAAAEGIRVAQGEAPHVKAVPGQVYKLTLRAAGGLEMNPRLPAGLLQTSGAPEGLRPARVQPAEPTDG